MNFNVLLTSRSIVEFVIYGFFFAIRVIFLISYKYLTCQSVIEKDQTIRFELKAIQGTMK